MNVLAVGIGGFFGAILRYLISEWLPITNGFPMGTFVINLSGCFFLAWFFTITVKRWSISPQVKLAIGTGFTGAFTTFSTFSVETLTLIEHQQYMIAFTYVFFSIFGGITLAFVGVKVAVNKGGKQ
ncbi:fluoride efflux transporter CrcB [Bacillus sp. FJAT-50079]|uniref:fluoride efflux transporter CrcB n=1 Tax=Bacillus sp. FJAT-50079 TaxID=2833577 RepID=UPI001BC9C4F4|nr:fluoride efflux transporter CrcB [Bacillus sp. FJAT-50079]MBS4209455.1 fluoride efflux transporter CrcB [Bacillus sp. FJAT-50079]